MRSWTGKRWRAYARLIHAFESFETCDSCRLKSARSDSFLASYLTYIHSLDLLTIDFIAQSIIYTNDLSLFAYQEDRKEKSLKFIKFSKRHFTFCSHCSANDRNNDSHIDFLSSILFIVCNDNIISCSLFVFSSQNHASKFLADLLAVVWPRSKSYESRQTMIDCFSRHCSLAFVKFFEKMWYLLELHYCIAYDHVKTTLLSMQMSMFDHFIDIVSIYLSIESEDKLCVFILFVCSFVSNVVNVVNVVSFYNHLIAFESWLSLSLSNIKCDLAET